MWLLTNACSISSNCCLAVSLSFIRCTSIACICSLAASHCALVDANFRTGALCVRISAQASVTHRRFPGVSTCCGSRYSHRKCRTRCRREAARYHRHKSKNVRIRCALISTSLSHQFCQACRQRAKMVLRQRVRIVRTMRSCCCFRAEAL